MTSPPALAVTILLLASAIPCAAQQSETGTPSVQDEQQAVMAARQAWERRKTAAIRALNDGRPDSDVDPIATVLHLDGDTVVISDNGSYGMFVASRTHGRFSKTWDNKDDGIESVVDCATMGDIPSPQLGQLPDTRRGEHRFYVVTTDCWIAGINHGFYLRIMRTNGRAMKVDLRGAFMVNADESNSIPKIDGNILHLDDMRGDKTFWRGGGGARYDWRIRLGRDKVEDLGRQPIDPERHAIDALFDRVQRKEPANGLASDAVIAKLQTYLATLRMPKTAPPGYLSLGELTGLSVKPDGSKLRACASFEPDHEGASDVEHRNFLFTMTGKGRHRYITNVKIHAGDEACGGIP